MDFISDVSFDWLIVVFGVFVEVCEVVLVL